MVGEQRHCSGRVAESATLAGMYTVLPLTSEHMQLLSYWQVDKDLTDVAKFTVAQYPEKEIKLRNTKLIYF